MCKGLLSVCYSCTLDHFLAPVLHSGSQYDECTKRNLTIMRRKKKKTQLDPSSARRECFKGFKVQYDENRRDVCALLARIIFAVKSVD